MIIPFGSLVFKLRICAVLSLTKTFVIGIDVGGCGFVDIFDECMGNDVEREGAFDVKRSLHHDGGALILERRRLVGAAVKGLKAIIAIVCITRGIFD